MSGQFIAEREADSISGR